MDVRTRRAWVVGGSRGMGRGVALALSKAGAAVTVTARPSDALDEMTELGFAVRAGDASDPILVGGVLDEVEPDLIVLSAGAIPLMRPIHRFDWEAFGGQWNVDTKATFHLVKEILARPLSRDARVVVFSSGAALGGSPLSGGYASAKQAQRYLCAYARKEIEALDLGFRVQCILPTLNLNTRLGAVGVKGYAARAGLPVEEFAAQHLPPGPTPEIAGAEILRLLTDDSLAEPAEFILSGDGLKVH